MAVSLNRLQENIVPQLLFGKQDVNEKSDLCEGDSSVDLMLQRARYTGFVRLQSLVQLGVAASGKSNYILFKPKKSRNKGCFDQH